MLIDVTAILLGDPSATFRRPPTEQEAMRAARMSCYEPKRGQRNLDTPMTRRLSKLPIGGIVKARSAAEAFRVSRWFAVRERYGRIKKQSNRLWLVTRLR